MPAYLLPSIVILIPDLCINDSPTLDIEDSFGGPVQVEHLLEGSVVGRGHPMVEHRSVGVITLGEG